MIEDLQHLGLDRQNSRHAMVLKFDLILLSKYREGARWKSVLEKLEKNGLVETRNGDRRMFFLTDKGYEMADKIKEEWKIDTNENPEQYL